MSGRVTVRDAAGHTARARTSFPSWLTGSRSSAGAGVLLPGNRLGRPKVRSVRGIPIIGPSQGRSPRVVFRWACAGICVLPGSSSLEMASNAATALAAKTKASKAWTQIMAAIALSWPPASSRSGGAVRSGGVGSEGETYGRSAADRLHIDGG